MQKDAGDCVKGNSRWLRQFCPLHFEYKAVNVWNDCLNGGVNSFSQLQPAALSTWLSLPLSLVTSNLAGFKAFPITQSGILHNPYGFPKCCPCLLNIPFIQLFHTILFWMCHPFSVGPWLLQLVLLIYFLRKNSTDKLGVHINKAFI